jgi:hypothetical protein
VSGEPLDSQTSRPLALAHVPRGAPCLAAPFLHAVRSPRPPITVQARRQETNGSSAFGSVTPSVNLIVTRPRDQNQGVRVGLSVGIAITLTMVIMRGWSALTGESELNLVSGVWLAHAVDVREGVFYRALIEDGYYGGSRYFPLPFLLVAVAMAAGLSPQSAGSLVGVVGGLTLVTGAWMCLTRLGVGRLLAMAGAVLAVAPYFVLQSVFTLRAEPLAAGLVCWGASFVAAAPRQLPAVRWAATAAICFTLAALAKPTALYAPVAAVLAIIWGGSPRDGIKLGALSALGWTASIGVMWLASEGRAVEVLLTGALGGGSIGGSLWALVRLDPVRLILQSHFLTATALGAMAAALVLPRSILAMPGLLMLAAAAASAVVLTTPGTILANQAVEPYVAAAVYLTWIASTTTRLRVPAQAVIALLLLWSSAHAVRDLTRLDERETDAAGSVALISSRCGPVFLSESPLLPVLAGSRPIMLDPFAFRVAAMRRPGLTEDLAARLRVREFGCVVLEMPPESPRGAGWYANVHLGTPVVDALTRHYTAETLPDGRQLYTPSE